MNRKNIIAGGITAILLLVIFSTPAAAGSRQRGRWEGVAIGLGAAVLGHALMHHHQATVLHRVPVDRHPPRHHYHHRRGHWEFQRVWVPPTFKKKWNPGRCGRRGRWIPGHWIREPVSRGHWKKERVWVVGR